MSSRKATHHNFLTVSRLKPDKCAIKCHHCDKIYHVEIANVNHVNNDNELAFGDIKFDKAWEEKGEKIVSEDWEYRKSEHCKLFPRSSGWKAMKRHYKDEHSDVVDPDELPTLQRAILENI